MYTKGRVAPLLILIIVTSGLYSGSGLAEPENFRAHLSGAQEVPPVATRAQGQAIFQLNRDDSSIAFKVNVANIENVTQAHIHCGAAGTNGPVLVFLFGLLPMGADVNGILAEGTVESADLIPRSDSTVCPGGVADFDDLLERIRIGQTYVNVHTEQNPAGEIRGQIQ